MQIKNTTQHYGLVNIVLHWIMAILIIMLISLGLYMTSLVFGTQKLKLYGLHKELGISILMLVVLRIIWRLKNVMPGLPNSMPWWEKRAAYLTHIAFYGFMIVLPITGWMMSSASGLPVSFFGLFVLPVFIHPDKALAHLLKEIHEYLAFGLIGVVSLHILAALKHHFIDKDQILKRMLKS